METNKNKAKESSSAIENTVSLPIVITSKIAYHSDFEDAKTAEEAAAKLLSCLQNTTADEKIESADGYMESGPADKWLENVMVIITNNRLDTEIENGRDFLSRVQELA